MSLVSVVSLKVENSWFRLPATDRDRSLVELNAIAQQHSEVDCRWFDSEPWSGGSSEFLLCSFSSLRSYHKFWNELRLHSVFTAPHARIGKVLLGSELGVTEQDIQSQHGAATPEIPATDEPEVRDFVAVVELLILEKWLSLDYRTRQDYALQMATIVSNHPKVRARWFDAEAWTGNFRDFVLCEFQELDDYRNLWNDLRVHPFLAHPYARIDNVCMGMARNPMDLLVEPPLGSTEWITCQQCAAQVKSKAKYCGSCGGAQAALWVC
jgi:hypothetical protein